MEKYINWQVGDISNDGHGKYDSFILKCSYDNNVNFTEFLTNIESSIYNVLGVDVANWFRDFEDSTIPASDVNKVKKLGFDFTEYHLNAKDNGDVTCSIFSTEEFLDIWLFLANKLSDSVKIEKTEDVADFYPNGGYGLFDI